MLKHINIKVMKSTLISVNKIMNEVFLTQISHQLKLDISVRMIKLLAGCCLLKTSFKSAPLYYFDTSFHRSLSLYTVCYTK